MPVEEIISKIIELRKNVTLFNLMLSELGVIRNNLQIAKNFLDQNNVSDAITQCELTSNDAIHHFLYNQAYLYSEDLQQCIYRIVTATQKMSYDIGRLFDELIDNKNTQKFKTALKQSNSSSEEDYMKSFLNNLINLALQNIDIIEKMLGYNIPQPEQIADMIKPSQ